MIEVSMMDSATTSLEPRHTVFMLKIAFNERDWDKMDQGAQDTIKWHIKELIAIVDRERNRGGKK